jgi:uncharacterized protein YjcR
MSFFTEIEKSVTKFIWKQTKIQIAKAICAKRAMLKVSQYLTSNYTIES